MPNDVLGREAIFVLPFLGAVLLAGEQHYTKQKHQRQNLHSFHNVGLLFYD
jgi:hypothetical protein